MRVTIRPYRPADQSAVLDLWSRASKLAHPFIANEGEGQRFAALRDIYLVNAENWVADDGGRIVGLLGLMDSEQGAIVGGLFVAPECQGHGIGRRLVAHAAGLKGALELEVFERNDGARAFYRNVGFTETGSRDDPDTGNRLVAMRLIP